MAFWLKKNKLLRNIGFFIFLFVGFYLFRQYYSPNRIIIRPVINSVEVNNKPLNDQSKIFLFDNDKEATVEISPNDQNEIILSATFPSVKLDQIGFDFVGQYLPPHEVVLFNGNSVVYSQVHNTATYDTDNYLFPRSLEVNRLTLHFQKIAKPIGISEIFFWQYSNTTPFGILFIPRGFFGYLSIIAIVWGIIFLCGLLVVKIIKVKEFGLGLIYSTGISLVFIISLLRFLLHNDFIYLIIPLIALFSLVTNYKQILSTFIENKFLLLIQLIAVLLLCALTSFFDLSPNISRYDSYYDFNSTYAFPIAYYKQDYLMPFGTAKIFFHNFDQRLNYPHLLGSYAVSDRTPLIPLFITPFLSFFGDRLFTYQSIIILLVSFIVSLSFNFQTKYFSPLVSKIIPLIFINQYFLYLYHFVPVRLIALYFLLNYFNELFFEKTPNWRRLLFFSLLSFLTHPVSLPYIFIPTLFLIFVRRDMKKSLFLIITFLVFILWILWGISLGKPNPFLLSPINTSAPSVGQSVVALDARKQIVNRIYNFLGLFIESPNPHIPGVGLGFYRFTAIGVTTISGFILFILAALGLIKNKKNNVLKSVIFFIIFLPALFVVFVSQASYSRRGMVDNLFPGIYMILVLGFNYLSSLSPILLLGGILLFLLENIHLLIKLDLVPMLPYFSESHILPIYNMLLSSIVLCYILFTALIIKYSFKSSKNENS